MKERKREKISEMVADFAREYLALGEDIEHKQQFLNSAVSAWNIASLKEKEREKAINIWRNGRGSILPMEKTC